MEEYIILGQVGKGSFGQVYKAKKRSDGEIVAYKVTAKLGRSEKELKGLRQECKIQRHLNHPNIIQMLDSFETEDEVVVVTEYADKELYEILGKAGRLSEERAQVIACDLVSALYYLHSNRVLHRDLKPQNVLLDSSGVAKLCDFGFARSMSNGTHVLTSIKGTPLYMAPELIEEYPYDHNVDLWSLGCIVFELIVGKPPFQTSNIIHLVRLIRHETIVWPDFISPHCKSFLQGLLQKDPAQRLTWPELLDHPFVKDRILTVGEGVPRSLTTPLSASQAIAKQQQLQSLVMPSNKTNIILEERIQKIYERDRKLREQQRTCISQPHYPMMQDYGHVMDTRYQALRRSVPSGTESSASIDVLLSNLSLRASLKSDLLLAENTICQLDCPNGKYANADTVRNIKNEIVDNEKRTIQYDDPPKDDFSNPNIQGDNVNVICRLSTSSDTDHCLGDGDCKFTASSRLSLDYEQEFGKDMEINRQARLPDWNPKATEQPIENEEWAAFLQRSMEEIMDLEIGSLLQENCVSFFVSPLRNPLASCKVFEYVACLLALPYVISISEEDLAKIQELYIIVRVVPNLTCAGKLLMTERSNQKLPPKSASKMSADELQALEYTMLLLCRLVHIDEKFLSQFCDAIYIIDGVPLIQLLLSLDKRKGKVVGDVIAIMNNILRLQPENTELVERVLLEGKDCRETTEHFTKLLTHRLEVVKCRSCILLRLLGQVKPRVLQQIWTPSLKNIYEKLAHDDNEKVRTTFAEAIEDLKQLSYYEDENSTDHA